MLISIMSKKNKFGVTYFWTACKDTKEIADLSNIPLYTLSNSMMLNTDVTTPARFAQV